METTYIASRHVARSSSKSDDVGAAQYPEDESTVTNSGSVTFRSSIAPRSLIIHRSSFNGGSLPGSSPVSGSYMRNRISTAHHASMNLAVMGPSVNSFALMSSTGVNAVKQSSDREKRDMQDLNERFASYIEKVRFLEAQNKKLIDELERLKAKWGRETSQIKAMYQAELDEARKVLDETTKNKARLEISVASLGDIIDETNLKLNDANNELAFNKSQIDKQNRQISDCDAELSLLRKRIEGFDMDKERDKKIIATLQEGLNMARSDLDQETLKHIDAENRRQTLEEDLEFLKTIHEQEMKELSMLAYKDNMAENREFWKTEMGEALREIQHIYDDKLISMRNELDGFYNLKVQEFKTGAARQSMETSQSKEEVKRLRLQFGGLKDRYTDLEAKNSQILRDLELGKRESDIREKEHLDENDNLKIELSRLKAEMESILVELQNIIDTKLGLELEIAAYRKLLEGEENRVGLRNVVDRYNSYCGADLHSAGGSGYSVGAPSHGGFNPSSTLTTPPGGSSVKVTQLLKGEMSAKTSYHKSAKGPISVSECSTDGRYIVVDNTSHKNEDVGGWKIVRTVDNDKKVEFVFKDGFTLGPNTKTKIWAHGCKVGKEAENDLECSAPNWGVGANVSTKLFNTDGEDRATHVQKTTYV